MDTDIDMDIDMDIEWTANSWNIGLGRLMLVSLLL